jgi:hypothetical protein
MCRHTLWQRLVANPNVSRILTFQPVMSIKLEIEKYTQDKDPENDQNS